MTCPLVYDLGLMLNYKLMQVVEISVSLNRREWEFSFNPMKDEDKLEIYEDMTRLLEELTDKMRPRV